jgi:hypothetical protein
MTFLDRRNSRFEMIKFPAEMLTKAAGNKRYPLLVFLSLAMSGCTSQSFYGPSQASKPGLEALQRIAERDAICRERKWWPYHDPNARGPGTGIEGPQCVLSAARPYDPLATPEGRHAQSLRLPDTAPIESYDYNYEPIKLNRTPGPVPFDFRAAIGKETSVAQQYFEHLCHTEGGEYVYRKVEDVEGILELRPRPRAYPGMLQHPLGVEDAYGWERVFVDSSPTIFLNDTFNGRRYRFFEQSITDGFAHIPNIWADGWTASLVHQDLPPPPVGTSVKYRHYTGKEYPKSSLKLTFTSNPIAHLAFTWRSIERPHASDYGISAGELLVLDLKTGEVLGAKRGFARSGFVKNERVGFDWEFSAQCPRKFWPEKKINELQVVYRFIANIANPPLDSTDNRNEK